MFYLVVNAQKNRVIHFVKAEARPAPGENCCDSMSFLVVRVLHYPLKLPFEESDARVGSWRWMPTALAWSHPYSDFVLRSSL